MSHEEDHVVGALVDLFKAMNVTCLVQVGAGDGYEAHEIQKAIGCRAVAIEGDSRQPQHSTTVEYHQALIGATDCNVNFYLNNTPDLSSECARGEGEVLTVLPQQRLDTFCDTHGITPDALIIDTEGTTLDVLEGCGRYMDGIRAIYAECQVAPLRPGVRHVNEVAAFLEVRGFTRHHGLPSYGETCGQGNFTWVRP